MKKKKKSFLLIILLIISVVFLGCSDPEKSSAEKKVDVETEEIEVLFDAPSFSRINTKELFNKLGETTEVERWNNKTTKGTFPMTIYSYDDGNNNHYEFIISDDSDSLVRATIYSSKYWNGDGENFKYIKKDMNKMLALLNIIPKDSAKIISDTGVAYRISPVSENVADVWFVGMGNDQTFEMVKITYNLNYFE